MFTFIGFSVAWIISCLLLGMIINSARVKVGLDIHDGMSEFIMGFTWGPLGILFGIVPAINMPMIIGGAGGTFIIFQISF